jgi:hypothetical protein
MTSTNEYLFSTQSVLQAGTNLRDLLDGDQRQRKDAVTQLERAAQRHQTGGADYRGFMFSEIEKTAAVDKGIGNRATGDVLASIMNDLNMSSMLMAAGQSVGEIGPQKDRKVLDETLLKLGNSTRTIERSMIGGGSQPGRFGFAGEAPAPKVKSVDLPAAIANFQKNSEAALTVLIEGARDAVMSIIEALANIDIVKVTEALGKIGGGISGLPRVGLLFRQGVELLSSALDSLSRFVGKDLIAKVKEQVAKIWEDLKEGKYVSQTVAWAFGVDAAREDIVQILKSEGLKESSLDEASNAFTQLGVAFKENMGLLQGIAGAVAIAGTLLLWVPGVGPQLTLVAASIYLLILGAVVLIGRDYTDSGPLQRVRGIREIAQGGRS